MPSNCFSNSNGFSSFTTNGMSNGSARHWPQDVGIINVEFYCPSEYIEQSELESYDGVSPGKYLIGLGQTRMAISSDHEDINSFCLTVTKRLMEKCNLTPLDIGFLMVGTETLIDKSKSIKTTLMQLFEGSGNHDVQGVDTTNACFGGTASIHHAVDWIESSSWDGRYAIVVCGDIAIYAEGPARPTCGAGAVAMLIGPNAPLIIERGVRSHYVRDTYDFYKPDFTSEYPVVDGKLSISCYMDAVYHCYSTYKKKFTSVLANSGDCPLKLNDFEGLIFHAPYCKIVQKALARLVFHEFKDDPNPDFQVKYKGLEKYWKKTLEETMFDREFESLFVKAASQLYDEKLKPSLLIATEVGNMYTASVYGCLVSFLSSRSAKDLAGKRVLIFSYGSGLAASMFSIRMSEVCDESSPLQRIQSSAQAAVAKLAERIKLTPAEFVKRLKEREEHYSKAPFTPKEDLDVLTPGTYYLTSVDKEFRRFYSRKPLATDGKQLPVKTPVIESLSLKD